MAKKKKAKKKVEAALFTMSDASQEDGEAPKKRGKKKSKLLATASDSASQATSFVSQSEMDEVASLASSSTAPSKRIRSRKAGPRAPLEPISPLTSLDVFFTYEGTHAPMSMVARLLASVSLMSIFLLSLLRGKSLDTDVPSDRTSHLRRAYDITFPPEYLDASSVPLNVVAKSTVMTGNVAQMVADGCKLVGITPKGNMLTKQQLGVFLSRYNLQKVLDEIICTAALNEAEHENRFTISMECGTTWTSISDHYENIILPSLSAIKIQKRWRCKQARRIFQAKMNLRMQGLDGDDIDIAARRTALNKVNSNALCAVLNLNNLHGILQKSGFLLTCILCHVTASERPAATLKSKELLLLSRAYGVKITDSAGVTVWNISNMLKTHREGLQQLLLDALDLAGVVMDCNTINVNQFMDFLQFFNVEKTLRDELVSLGCLKSPTDMLNNGIFCLLSGQGVEPVLRATLVNEETQFRSELTYIADRLADSTVPKRQYDFVESEVRIPLTAFKTDKELILYGDTEDYGKILIVQRTWRMALWRKRVRLAVKRLEAFWKTVNRVKLFRRQLSWLKKRRRLLKDPGTHIQWARVKRIGKGHLARMDLKLLQSKQQTAVTLQRIGRGFLGRSWEVFVPVRSLAAEVVQRVGRAYMERAEGFMVYCQKCYIIQQCTVLQQTGRAFTARSALFKQHVVKHVSLLQKAGRAHIQRHALCGAHYIRNAVLLQRVGRGLRCRAIVRSKHVLRVLDDSARKLQKAGWGCIQRRRLHGSYKVAVGVKVAQRMGRAHTARVHFGFRWFEKQLGILQHVGRSLKCRLLLKQQFLEQSAHLKLLQRAGRGGATRAALCSERHNELQQAILMLQRTGKGTMDRSRCKRLYAVRCLLRVARGSAARNGLRDIHKYMTKVATTIQSRVRQWRARARFEMLKNRMMRRKKHSVKIHQAMRMYHAKRALTSFEEVEAANKIKLAWNNMKLRREVYRRVEGRHAARIQQLWKRAKARKLLQFLKQRKLRIRQKSVTKIQQAWRFKHAKRVMEEEEKKAAAVTLQHAWTAAKSVKTLRKRVSAKRLQRVGRASVVRSSLSDEKVSRSQATLLLQRVLRACFVRSDLREFRSDTMQLQAVGRGMCSRVALLVYTQKRQKDNLLNLQRLGRGLLSRHAVGRKSMTTSDLVRRLKTIKVLQRCGRGYVDRDMMGFLKRDISSDCSEALQCVGRGYRARMELGSVKWSVKTLQRLCRGHRQRASLARKVMITSVLHSRKKSIVVLQRCGKGLMSRLALIDQREEEILSALVIQKAWLRYVMVRGDIDLEAKRYKAQQRGRHKAAAKIQDRWREHLAKQEEHETQLYAELSNRQLERRKKSVLMLTELTNHADAIHKRETKLLVIQRIHRGHIARCTVFHLRTRTLMKHLASTTQPCGRALRARRDVFNMLAMRSRTSMLCLQRLGRGLAFRFLLARVYDETMKSAAPESTVPSDRESTSSEVSAVLADAEKPPVESIVDYTPSVIVLQAWVRTTLARAVQRKLQRAAAAKQHAIVLEAFILSWTSTIFVSTTLVARNTRTCLVMQKMGRGYVERVFMYNEHCAEEARKIQKTWRGKLARHRSMSLMQAVSKAKTRHEMRAIGDEKSFSANWLQAIGRAYLARRFVARQNKLRMNEVILAKKLKAQRESIIMTSEIQPEPKPQPAPPVTSPAPEPAPAPAPKPRKKKVAPLLLATLLAASALVTAKRAMADVLCIRQLTQKEAFLRFLLKDSKDEGAVFLSEEHMKVQKLHRAEVLEKEHTSRRRLLGFAWLVGLELSQRCDIGVYEVVGRDLLRKAWFGEWEESPVAEDASKRRRRTRLMSSWSSKSRKSMGRPRTADVTYRRGTVSARAYSMHSLELVEVHERDKNDCMQEDLRNILQSYTWFANEVAGRNKMGKRWAAELVSKVVIWNSDMLDAPSVVSIAAATGGVIASLYPAIIQHHDRRVLMTASALSIVMVSTHVVATMDTILVDATMSKLPLSTLSPLDHALCEYSTAPMNIRLRLPIFFTTSNIINSQAVLSPIKPRLHNPSKFVSRIHSLTDRRQMLCP